MVNRRTFLSSVALAAAVLPFPQSAMSLFSSRPKLVIFDVIETLLDLGKLQVTINTEFGSEFAFKQWFSLLLQ